jgi:hypothetical protein
MAAESAPPLKNTREILEAIGDHPEATADIRLPTPDIKDEDWHIGDHPEATADIRLKVAIALDHLDAGNDDEALRLIRELLL